MAEQIRKSKKVQDKDETVDAEMPSAGASEALDGLDDLLDEIDAVLEQNAEEFVTQYIQKGGE